MGEDTNEQKDDLVEEREDYFMLNSSYKEYLDNVWQSRSKPYDCAEGCARLCNVQEGYYSTRYQENYSWE